jgi:hypothetical protein
MQLLAANRKWLSLGPRALGALGQAGAASNDDAKWAWTKATDGKITQFREDAGMDGEAIDAGRVVGPGFGQQMLEGPPEYVGPPREEEVVSNGCGDGGRESTPAVAVNGERGVTPPMTTAPSKEYTSGAPRTQAELSLEAGRSHLARLRQERIK